MEVTTREYALALDAADPLAKYREKFVINDPDQCYLDGNSLGRLPKATIDAVNNFMVNEWGKEVVAGWAHWVDEAQTVGNLLGRAALGAAAGQVLVCDTTSINFYQLALAAIQARPNRKTIIIDAAPNTDALPRTIFSAANQASVAAAAATCVTIMAYAADPLAPNAEPALNPNQPTQSMLAPITVKTRL